MTKLTPPKSREVVKGLNKLGFEKARQKGSHAIFHHQLYYETETAYELREADQ